MALAILACRGRILATFRGCSWCNESTHTCISPREAAREASIVNTRSICSTLMSDSAAGIIVCACEVGRHVRSLGNLCVREFVKIMLVEFVRLRRAGVADVSC